MLNRVKNITSLLVISYLIIILGTMVLYLTKTTPLNIRQPISPDIFSSYGSFISGVVGPLFTLVGVLYLIKSIEEQRAVFTKQQIEDRFFNLLSIARDNTNQISIIDRSGSRAIVTLVDELNLSYETAKPVFERYDIDNTRIHNVAYLAFYFGACGDSSVAILCERLKNQYPEDFIVALIGAYYSTSGILSSKYGYKLFDGHQSRLGHYYRHLYQTVVYINEQHSTVLSYHNKYQYIKTLRAQLSTHEQLLFLWNSVSDLGRNWENAHDINDIDHKLITKYNIVKNIPRNYSQYIDAMAYYPLVDYEDSISISPNRTAMIAAYT